MVNVLIVGMTATPGGVESFLMNYCYNRNMIGVHFDFLVPSNEKAAYSKEICQHSNIYYIVPKRANPILHKKQLKAFFIKNIGTYSAVWANLNSLMNVDYLIAAKNVGVKRIIVHSHNSSNMGGSLQWLLHSFNKRRIGNIATDYWACSEGAKRWFYPPYLRSQVKIIRNAIDITSYLFDAQKRKQYRAELSMDGRRVIGHIGRLHFQKNQLFLLDIMKELVSEDDSYLLILIGIGPDEQKLRKRAMENGIESNVIFLGTQTNIGGWLSAFDVFVFPSFFEGLSIVCLEAQANGLPIVASTDAINDEGMINPNRHRLELNNNAEEWAEKIKQSIVEKRMPKDDVVKNFKQSHFEIDSEAAKLAKSFRDME